MERVELEAELWFAKLELAYAGPVHARDLEKYIRRLEKRLKILNHTQKGA
ncbi:MAG: hypothetical protein IJ769_11450 [Clostridia bacterium]|nr:hypothetical protein [Clostridia bacterium]